MLLSIGGDNINLFILCLFFLDPCCPLFEADGDGLFLSDLTNNTVLLLAADDDVGVCGECRPAITIDRSGSIVDRVANTAVKLPFGRRHRLRFVKLSLSCGLCNSIPFTTSQIS